MQRLKLTTMAALMCSGLFWIGGDVSAQTPTQEINAQPSQQQNIEQVMAIADVYGDGEKVSAVILKYSHQINPRTVTPKTFYVAGRTVEAVYTNDKPELTDENIAGNYVILKLAYENKSFDGELSQQKGSKPLQPPQGKIENKAENKNSSDSNSDVEVFSSTTNDKPMHKPDNHDAPMQSNRKQPDLSVKVRQVGTVISTDNVLYLPNSQIYTATAKSATIIDSFKQLTYTDSATGNAMPYNLYLPQNYDTTKKYPLLVFIADASANNNDIATPLYQGNGATVFATEAEQSKHECIILAPQYTADLVNKIGMMTTDKNIWTPGLTLVTNLIFDVINNYSVDKNRIYGTGQSQGGMANIAISDKYPDLFAAQYLVACQWNVDEMAVLKDKNLWITVCEGDIKAFPGMNEAVDKWSSLGSKVARNKKYFDSKASIADINKKISDMINQNANINYTVFKGGNHMYTWSFAYNIETIRDWIFSKSK